MSDQRDEEYQSAIGELRDTLGGGLGDASLVKIERRVMAELSQRRARPASRGISLAVGFAAAVAVALLVLAPRLRERFYGTPEAPTIRVVMRGGPAGAAVNSERGVFGARDVVNVPAAGRLDLAVGDDARVSMSGPARLAVAGDGQLTLEAGSAAFAVRHQPRGRRFVVAVGAASVTVHGTRFAVATRDGVLEGVRVDEGVVEVRPERGEPVMVRAGEGWGAAPPLGDERFAQPWWDAQGPLSVVTVESTPPGASVFIAGANVGETPLRAELPRGSFHVAMRLAGYAEDSTTVELDGAARTIKASLTPIEGHRSPRPPIQRGALDPWHDAEQALARGACGEVQVHVNRLLERTHDQDEDANALMLLGECWMRSASRKKALEPLDRVVSAYPGAAAAQAALFESSKLRAELMLTAEADKGFARYLELYPQGPFAEAASFRRCELAAALRGRSAASSCIADHLQRFARGRRVGDALLLSGSFACSDERWADAERAYWDYLERIPPARDDVDNLRELLRCLAQGRVTDLDRARGAFHGRHPEVDY